MKATGYILSFYLLLLSAVPCCAFDACPDKDEPAAQTAGHKPATRDDCGACSPFFNCERCASVTIDLQVHNFLWLSRPSKKVYTDFIPPLIPDAHYDFWQPPRVQV